MKIKATLAAFAIAGCCSSIFAQETDLATLDKDCDGKVLTAEFKAYVEGKLPEFEMLDKFVEKVDADGNGEISESEFEGRMEILRSIQEVAAGEQEEGKSEEKAGDSEQTDDEAVEAAEELFKNLMKAVEDEEWETAASKMTKEARDDFCFETVMMALAFSEMELPAQIPGLSDAKEEIEDVVDTFELNKLDIDVEAMIQMEMGAPGEGDDEEDEDMEAKQAEQKETVIQALDKDGKRWEIIGAIWDAQSSSPFHMSPLAGEIKESELEGDVCFLTVAAKPPAAGGGVQIEVMAPPSIIRIEKTDEGWKYAGRDLERTQKAMEEFMEGMQGMGGIGAGPDF